MTDRMTDLPAGLRDIIEAQTEHLDRMRADSARRLLREVVRARGQLAGSIASLEASGTAPYTLHQHRQYLIQLEATIQTLTKNMTAALDGNAARARRQGIRDTVQQVKVSSREFGQSDVPLSIPEASRLVDGRSKLREIEHERARRGAARYGLEMTGTIERDLAQSMLMGETTFQAQQRLIGKNVWLDSAYKAERLARTEFSEAYNASSRVVLDEVAGDDPGLWVMWHEHAKGPQWAGPKDIAWKGPAKPLDKRVGEDSLRLHGQLRRPGEAFVDPVTGRVFDHPPNRPNDRATLVMVRVGGGKGERPKESEPATPPTVEPKRPPAQEDPIESAWRKGPPPESSGPSSTSREPPPQPRGPELEPLPRKSVDIGAIIQQIESLPQIRLVEQLPPPVADADTAPGRVADNITDLLKRNAKRGLSVAAKKVEYAPLNDERGAWIPGTQTLRLDSGVAETMKAIPAAHKSGRKLTPEQEDDVTTILHEVLHAHGSVQMTGISSSNDFYREMTTEIVSKWHAPTLAPALGIPADVLDADRLATLQHSVLSSFTVPLWEQLVALGMTRERAETAFLRFVVHGRPSDSTKYLAAAIKRSLEDSTGKVVESHQVERELKVVAWKPYLIKGLAGRVMKLPSTRR